jgi:dihydropteroate synthase
MLTTSAFSTIRNRTPYSLNCRGALVDLSSPVVMGILNLTPDSFYDGGKFTEENIIPAHIEQMVLHGAMIIDIGAASSRPGATLVSEEEELNRLLPVLRQIRSRFPNLVLSVDTWRSKVAIAAVDAGADIINDISGGDMDPEMFRTMADLKVPYILMHMQGTPATMQKEPSYENVVTEVLKSLQQKVQNLRNLGVNDIVVDPGFGFGKSTVHNYRLLADLELFHQLQCPVLVGFSRKSMINKVLGTSPKTALNGTSVLNTIALQKGASILRVHDVLEATQCIQLVNQLK